MTTLSDGTTTITLPSGLKWSDYTWSPVAQTSDYTLTGAVIVQLGTAQAGRPITLEPADDSSAWALKPIVDQIEAWAAVAGKQLTLVYMGTSYVVIFRHQDAPAVLAEPVVFFDDPDSTDYYRLTLKMMGV